MQSDIMLQSTIAVAVLALVAVIAWLAFKSIRSRRLRHKFGPEYDYTIKKVGDRSTAEETLAERQRRVNQLEIHHLDPSEKDRYQAEWIEIQSEFVDDPAETVEKADKLITEIMIARGFPVADFEQRTADVSVMYPEFVSDYRNGHALALKNQNGGSSTEELRQAMVDYRNLVESLLETEEIRVKELAV